MLSRQSPVSTRQLPGNARQVTVDVSGATACRLVMNAATTAAIANGTLGVQVQWEISQDGGQTWSANDTIDRFYGKAPGKSPFHFVEVRARRPAFDAFGRLTTEAFVWGLNTAIRFHWRQTKDLAVGVTVELEK